MSPGSSELFLLDNGATDLRGVCGAFTWEIRAGERGNLKPVAEKGRKNVGKRLVVTYRVAWG